MVVLLLTDDGRPSTKPLLTTTFFALPAALLCAFAAWRIAKRYPRIRSDRPELEIFLK